MLNNIEAWGALNIQNHFSNVIHILANYLDNDRELFEQDTFSLGSFTGIAYDVETVVFGNKSEQRL